MEASEGARPRKRGEATTNAAAVGADASKSTARTAVSILLSGSTGPQWRNHPTQLDTGDSVRSA